MSLRSKIRTIIFDSIWLLIFAVSLPWLAWRFLAKGKNRRGWKQKLFGLSPIATQSSAKRIWLHAVSVGEVHLLETLIDHLRQKHGDVVLFISTTSETGYDRAVSLFSEQHEVFFFPFDFSWAIRNAIKRTNPDMLVLAELELWPNLIHLAAEAQVPVVVANGRLSENSHRNYRRFGMLTRPMFSKLHHVGAQDQVYARRFVDLGCAKEKVTVTGNLKYDSIETNRDNVKTNMCRAVASDYGIVREHPVLVAGSTQIEDEAAAVDAWLRVRSSIPQLKLILVPRHPDRIGEIESLLAERDLVGNRRSRHGSESVESSILIVDVIGELSGWWGVADVAFVGGSMGSRGGQNMIEPAAYGLPVCFGPNTANFQSTVEGLLTDNGAIVVEDSKELAEFTSRMLTERDEALAIGKRAQEFVLRHRGAADRTVKILDEILLRVDDWRLDRAA